MIMYEAEDFEVFWRDRSLGRFMVNSKEPFEVDTKVFEHDIDPREILSNYLESGRIIRFEPDFTITIGIFGDVDIQERK